MNLAVGSKVSVVGIEHETQRRNRLNATVKAVGRDTLHLHSDQSYGNCPKYIHVRDRAEDVAATIKKTRYLAALDDASSAHIRRAESFFIASRSAELSDDPRTGVDVNHRGGLPGFAHVIDPYKIEFPDYRGNSFFNTLGNITQDNRVGIQFIDCVNCDLCDIRGHAELSELAIDHETLTGTLVRIHLEEVARTAGAFPRRYTLVGYSDRNPAV